jgi:hypothetical protein
MIFDFYNKFGALNSEPIFKAFEQGLMKLGHSVEHHTGQGEAAVIWSVLWNGRMYYNKSIWNQYRTKNLPVVVLEVGGIKRNHTWKISVNGINRGSYFINTGNDSRRKEKLGINCKPWRSSGDFILICGQHEKSLQWDGNPKISTWIEQKILEIKKVTDRPIVIRPHPRNFFSLDYNRLGVTKSTNSNFYLELSKAWAVVAHNSNPGTEAIINGIPAVVDNSSLAWPVSTNLSEINIPSMPNRDQWINDLAWTEWTVDEIAQGIPQSHLINYLQFSKITGSSTDVI